MENQKDESFETCSCVDDECECNILHSEVLLRINKKMPQKQNIRELSDLFKVFSDYTRLQILCALECKELCVCDLSELLDMSMSAISHQLKVLRLANLIKYRRDGKNVFYSLADDHVKDILLQGFEHTNEK